ncbi:MAG TPA: hypothetical protein VE075_04730 [Thermoanaerobaculia bacterium]|nr:hypothetical protein [Thermoanaerobaculia bacterium]
MSTEKVSLTLDKELVAEAREVAGGRALSGYLNRALRNQLQHDRVAGLLAELEREKGPIDPRVMAEVRAEWPAPGKQATRRRSA